MMGWKHLDEVQEENLALKKEVEKLTFDLKVLTILYHQEKQKSIKNLCSVQTWEEKDLVYR